MMSILGFFIMCGLFVLGWFIYEGMKLIANALARPRLRRQSYEEWKQEILSYDFGEAAEKAKAKAGEG